MNTSNEESPSFQPRFIEGSKGTSTALGLLKPVWIAQNMSELLNLQNVRTPLSSKRNSGSGGFTGKSRGKRTTEGQEARLPISKTGRRSLSNPQPIRLSTCMP